MERWKLIVLFVLLGTGIAVLVTATTPKSYEASVQMFVATTSTQVPDSNVQFQAVAFTQTQVQTFAQIVASPGVLKLVRNDLQLKPTVSDGRLRSEITAGPPVGQSIVNLHVSDASPDFAARLANSAANAF